MLDPVGNRQSLTSSLAALQAQTFTYDADDRISGDTFDANGNTITSDGVTYTYDFEDRLVGNSSGVTIVYDGDGNRISESAAGVTTKYLVDDQTPTGYAQVAEELVSGVVTAQYTYGPMRISQRRTATSFYGYDAGGSVRQLFDNTGTITDKYSYDAFGSTVSQTGSTVNEFQYRGEQNDASLQMYYLRARYYRPQTGRFLSQDSYEGDDEEPVSLHKYLYANADPVDGMDPTGYENVEAPAITAQNFTKTSTITRMLSSMRGITLGQVQRGAKLAYDTICCLDKTWSVLGLALDSIAIVTGDPSIAEPTDAALSLIDVACKLGCKNGETRHTANGRRIHTDFKNKMPLGPGWQYEYTLGPYRFDAINFGLGIVAELKPGTLSGVSKGASQLKCYVNFLNQVAGGSGPWKPLLILY